MSSIARFSSALIFTLVERTLLLVAASRLLRGVTMCVAALTAPLSPLVQKIHPEWTKCTHNHCKNNGVCYRNTDADFFCICSEDYGGHECERLVDAIKVNEPMETVTLLFLCMLALALLAAAIGWALCIFKHLNARRLYLANRKLAEENSVLREYNRRNEARNARVTIALKRVGRLCDAEFRTNTPVANANNKNVDGSATNVVSTVSRAQILHELAHIRAEIESANRSSTFKQGEKQIFPNQPYRIYGRNELLNDNSPKTVSARNAAMPNYWNASAKPQAAERSANDNDEKQRPQKERRQTSLESAQNSSADDDSTESRRKRFRIAKSMARADIARKVIYTTSGSLTSDSTKENEQVQRLLKLP